MGCKSFFRADICPIGPRNEENQEKVSQSAHKAKKIKKKHLVAPRNEEDQEKATKKKQPREAFFLQQQEFFVQHGVVLCAAVFNFGAAAGGFRNLCSKGICSLCRNQIL